MEGKGLKAPWGQQIGFHFPLENGSTLKSALENVGIFMVSNGRKGRPEYPPPFVMGGIATH